MNFTNLIAVISHGVRVVEQLEPLATAIGGPIVGSVIKTVESLSEVSSNVMTRVAEAKQVLNEVDQKTIADITARLAAINDKLAKAVENS